MVRRQDDDALVAKAGRSAKTERDEIGGQQMMRHGDAGQPLVRRFDIGGLGDGIAEQGCVVVEGREVCLVGWAGHGLRTYSADCGQQQDSNRQQAHTHGPASTMFSTPPT